MSVDRCAVIGFGWLITNEEYEKMYEYVGDDNWYNVADEFMWVDAYDEQSDKFLGYTFDNIPEGCARSLNEILDYITAVVNHDDFIEHYTKVLEYCGQKIEFDNKWSEPKLYLINWLH